MQTWIILVRGQREELRAYLIAIWSVVGAALVGAIYFGLGGRALLGATERPERVLGKRVQLKEIESGPAGLDPEQPSLPPAVVEAYEPDEGYRLRFETPTVWLGRPETHVTVAARAVGYPISLVAGLARRRVWVAGRFESGEALLGVLQRV